MEKPDVRGSARRYVATGDRQGGARRPRARGLAACAASAHRFSRQLRTGLLVAAVLGCVAQRLDAARPGDSGAGGRDASAKAVARLKTDGHYDSLMQAVTTARYAVRPLQSAADSPSSGTPIPGTEPRALNPAADPSSAFFALNPANGFGARFTSQGIQLNAADGAATAPWQLALRLRAAGGEKSVTAVPEAPPTATDSRTGANRVEYRRGAITEWYENCREGLEQGFTLAARPAAAQAGEAVRLVLAVNGDLCPVAVRGADQAVTAISFVTPGGAKILGYKDLRVWDAAGRTLPARMQVQGRDVALIVDDARATYPVTVDPLIYTETKIVPNAGSAQQAGDDFGYSVAISGDTAVIGAYLDHVGAWADAGSAYVFVRSGGVWTQQAQLTAGDAAATDGFGWSVAVSGDTAVVGAKFDDLAVADAGSAYVFVRSGTTWSQQAKLTASDGLATDAFGNSVSMSGDTVLVGAYADDTTGGADAGSAYVFVRSGTTWSQQAHLVASDTAAGDTFGYSVSLSGETALVGSYQDDTTKSDAGSAYVFVRSGTTWSQQAKLTASDAAASDKLGVSVSLSGDTALVGAFQDDTTQVDAGSAYVFVRSGTTWSQQAKLTASDAAATDYFGWSVAVSGDTAAVGSLWDDTTGGANTGSVCVFVRSGTTWTQQMKIVSSDAAANDNVGSSAAISGGTVLAGAPYDDNTAGTDAGSVYIYDVFDTLHHFAVTAVGGGSIGTQTPGTPFPIQVTAKDSGNRTVANFTGTVQITSTGPLTTGGGTTASFVNGVLASHSVTLAGNGTFTLTATKTGSAETGTSNTFAATGGVPCIWYVDAARADDSGQGFTWATAKRTVQAAIDAAVAVGGGQVWVKAGTYKPTTGTDRTIFITLKTGVAVYGGFAGTETSLTQRNVAANVTILSADIGTAGVSTDNSYHAVYANAITNARLDGFTITAGNADATTPNSCGGGLYCANVDSTSTVANCTFSGNSGSYGGAVFCDASAVRLTNCVFNGNSATFGGGLRCDGAPSPIVTNCTFSGNTASQGGSVQCFASSPTLINCIFTGSNNKAIYEYLASSDPVVTNCLFYANPNGDYCDEDTTVLTGAAAINALAGNSGNVAGDPKFVNAAGGNFHLGSASAAIDAGTATGAPTTDLDGNSRPVDIPDLAGTSTYDIGAYEAQAVPPVPPTTPGATAFTNGIIWSWADASSNETGFKVWADAGATAPTTLRITAAAGAISWPYSSLAANTQYSFQVAATNAAGDSAKTTTFSKYTLAAVPVAPTVNTPALTSLRVAVGAGDGNPAATTYAIQITPAVSGNSWVQAGGAVGAAAVWQTAAAWGTTTVTGLTSNTAYAFSVKARNAESVETALGPTGSGATLGPEINLKQGVASVADGATCDVGPGNPGSITDTVFTIENTGATSLTLTTPVTITGANADQFSIQAQPTSPVAAGGTTTFTVRFAPTSLGTKTAAISIANNDLDENPYDLALTAACLNVWRVDASRPDDSGNGASWATAKKTIQAAIDVALFNGGEVWAKAGTHLPTKDTSGNASPANPRTKTFTHKGGVKLYGGFAGTEMLRSQRDVAANVTILSGDIGTVGDATDNCWHVVYYPNSSVTNSYLDGFIITGGYADGLYPQSCGGGIYCIDANTTYTIANCTIVGNYSYDHGGGVYLNNSSPALTNCRFAGNSTGPAHNGGGIACYSNSSPTVTNCTFTGNTASYGGAVYVSSSFVPLVNCTLSGNTAGTYGGAVFLQMTNSVTLTNCILSNNSNAALYEYDSVSDPTVTNCLFVNNPNGDYRDFDTTATYSVAQFGSILPAAKVTACVGTDPRFVMDSEKGLAGTWTGVAFDALTGCTTLTNSATTFTPAALVGRLINGDTSQCLQAAIVANTDTAVTVLGNVTAYAASGDSYKLMDYHLWAGSGAIDAGTASGAPSTDIEGSPRPVDIPDLAGTSTYDIGAYEAQVVPPAPATNPGATAIATTSITWTWMDNSSNEIGFNVWADPGNAAPTTMRTTTGAGVTSWQYSGLTVNTQYSCQVESTNATGDSAKTTTFTRYTLANAPLAPTVNSPTGNTMHVAIGAGDGNPAITTYAIQLSPAVAGNSWVQADGTLAAAAAWQTAAAWGTKTVTGLAGAVTYTFAATARNGDGTATAAGPGAAGTTLTVPEVDLKQGSTGIADGGSYGFGSRTVGSTTDIVFTIENTGAATVTLTTPLTVTGTDAALFSIIAQPTSPVAAGGTTTFTVRFAPTTTGAKSAAISFANNDADENPYDLALTGTGTTPEVNLKQGSTGIADGGSYGFGSKNVGGTIDIVFTIENTGTGPLTLTTPLTVTGTDAGLFSVTAQPTSPVAAGGTTTFTVRFAPTTTGAKAAAISFANDDTDENPYDLNLTGTGTTPEINLKQAVTNIADGGSYDFGSKNSGTTTAITFTIENTGTGPLTLTTPLTLTGTNANQFNFQTQPTSPVAAGGTTTFTVRFVPTSTGAKSAAIAIANDDSNENPYDLNLTGTGTAPEINLKQGSTSIADGGSYNFGSANVGSTTDIVFTIENTGTGSLSVTTPLTVTGANANQFSIQVQPTSTVATGGTTTFTVRFAPTATGAKSAAISFANGDSNETPYDLSLTATATTPEINLKQGSTSIADGGSYDFGSRTGGTTTNVVFTIENSGTGPLTLTTPLTVTGADAGHFSVIAQPTSPVAVSGTTTFTVRFAPTAPGAKSANISIANNDSDENPYDLALTGSVPAVWYVDGTRPDDSGNGFAWASAKRTLQAGIDAASNAGGGEVRVKAGTYRPTVDAGGNASPADSRTKTFVLKTGASVYGGFAGTETLRSERDWTTNVTTLSGDVAGNDNATVSATEPTRSENCYHVVTGSGTTSSAVLDGFTVTGGNANTVDTGSSGGGMYNDAGSPTVRNCTLTRNTASANGAGMTNLSGSSPVIANVSFIGNAARSGGGMYDFETCHPTLTNVVFCKNTASSHGGGVYDRSQAAASFTNVSFSGNTATGNGGGLLLYNGTSPVLTNCILWGNSDVGGTDESAQIHRWTAGSDNPTVTYSVIQGGWTGLGGTGVIATDPQFADAANSDLHLTGASPAIDAGNGTSAPATDREGNSRIDIAAKANTGTGTPAYVDLGAYEFLGGQPVVTTADASALAASISAGGTPQCTVSLGGSALDGGDPTVEAVTERGVCCSSTNPAPTIADNKLANGAGFGTFSSPIATLTPGTFYYFRAYATNPAGTTYGSVKTFRTPMSQPGNALQFDGTDDVVVIPHSSSLNLAASFTLETWVKFDEVDRATPAAGTWMALFAKSAAADAYGLMLNTATADKTLRFYHNGAALNETSYNWTTVAAGTWYHLAATFDGSVTAIYIDGVAVVQQEVTGTVDINTNALQLGCAAADYYPLHGQLDEARVWNVARTPQQIRENMGRQLTGSETNLVAYYRFDHVAGTVLQDLAANGHDGTLTNMTVPAAWVASAAFNSWTGQYSTSWAEPRNWSRGTVPVATDCTGIPTAAAAPTLSGAATARTLALSTGGVLNGGSGQTLAVTGHWFNYGTFTAGTSTVQLTGSGQYLAGNTTFYRLQKDLAAASASDTLTCEAGSTQTIANTLTLAGKDTGTRLRLRSSQTGTTWTLTPNGSRVVDWIDVRDCVNGAAASLRVLATHGTDAGNNTKWVWVGTPTVAVTTPVNDSTPTWTWAGSGTGASFRYQLDGGGWVATAATTWTAGTALADGAHSFAVQEGDDAGNWSASASCAITLDSTAPTVALATAAANPTALSPFLVTIAFSEAVNGFTADDIIVTNGTVASFAGTGASYSANIVPAAPGAVTINVAANAAQDAALNGNTAATPLSRTYDNDRPAAVMTSTAPSDTRASPIPVTVTFSEPVTGFVVGDITVGNGAAGSFTAVSSTVYTANITPTGQGTVTVSVAQNVAQDAALLWNTASAPLTRTYDTAAPTVALSTNTADPTNVSPTVVTFTFSEAVTGFATGDLTVGNGTATGFTAVSGTVYTANVTPAGQGTVTVSVAASAATDAAGNNSQAGSRSWTYDSVPPNAPAVTGTTPTTNPRPTWSWTAGGGGNGTFRCQLDGTAGAWTQLTALNWTPGTDLSADPRTHVLYVQERDAAGSWSASGSFGISRSQSPLTVNAVTIEVTWVGHTPDGSYEAVSGGYNVTPPYRLNGKVVCNDATATLQVRGTTLTGKGALALNDGYALIQAGETFTMKADTTVLRPAAGGATSFGFNGRSLDLVSATIPATGAIRYAFCYPELPRMIFTNVERTQDGTGGNQAAFTTDSRATWSDGITSSPLVLTIGATNGFAAGQMQYSALQLVPGSVPGITSLVYGNLTLVGGVPQVATACQAGSWGLTATELGTWNGTTLSFTSAKISSLDNTVSGSARIQPVLTNLVLTPGTPVRLQASAMTVPVDGMTMSVTNPVIGDKAIALDSLTLPTAPGNVKVERVTISGENKSITSAGNITVNGTPVRCTAATFRANGVTAPEAYLGTAPAVRLTNSTIDHTGFHAGDGNFNYGGLNFVVNGGELPNSGTGYDLTADLQFPAWLPGGTMDTTILFNPELKMNAVNYCTADLNKTLLSSFLTLPQLCISYDQGPPVRWGGTGLIEIPDIITVNMELGIADGKLDKLILELDGLPIPIGTTGAVLARLKAGGRNLSRVETCVTQKSGVKTCVVPPMEFLGGLSVTAGPEILGVSLVRGDLDGVVSEVGFDLTGAVSVFIFKAGGGELAVIWSGPGKGVSGNLWVRYLLVIEGRIDFDITALHQAIAGMISIIIPEQIPFIGGWRLASIRLAFTNPPARFSGSLRIKIWFIKINVGFHIDKSGIHGGARDGVAVRAWETPFQTQYTLPPERDGEDPGVITFFTNFTQTSRVYSDQLAANPIRGDGVDVPVTLTSTNPTFIRLTYQNEGAVPQLDLTAPDGTVYPCEAVPFDPSDEDRSVHFRHNPDAKDACYLLAAPAVGNYTLHVRNPEDLGEYGVEVQVENIAPTLSFTSVASTGSTLDVTWTDADPDDNAEIRFFLDTDREGGNGVEIAGPISEDDPVNGRSIDLASRDLAAGTYWLYATISDGRQYTDPIYSDVPVVIGDVEAPPAPANIRVAATDTQALVTWDAVTDPDLLNYKVEWTEDLTSRAYRHSMSAPADATAALITGLEPNRAYRITVKAVKLATSSPPGRAAGFALMRDAQTELLNRRAADVDVASARTVLSARASAAGRGALPEWQLQSLAQQTALSTRMARIQERYRKASLRGQALPVDKVAVAKTRDETAPVYLESIETESVVVNTIPPAGDNTPVIASIPGEVAMVGETYRYQVAATDADGAPLTYTLTSAPAGMTVSTTGLVTWTPTAAAPNVSEVILEVSDGEAHATQSWHVTAATMQSEQPLLFLNKPVATWAPGTVFTFTPKFNRPAGTAITFDLVDGPAGMAMVGNTLTWTVPGARTEATGYDVILTAREGTMEATADFHLTVADATGPDEFDLESDEPAVQLKLTETDDATAVTELQVTDTFILNLPGGVPTATVTLTMTPQFPLDLGAGAGHAVTQTFEPDSSAADTRTITVSAVADPAETGPYTRTITFGATGSSEADVARFGLAPLTVSVTKAPPAVPEGSLRINSNAALTNSAAVTLTIVLTDSDTPAALLQMRFSNDNATWSDWEPYAATKSWTLAAGDGTKTVWARFQDADGNESSASDSIVLDETPPSAPALESAESVTANPRPTWTWTAAGGGNGTFRFHLDTAAWTETAATTFQPGTALADGDHTVTVQERDDAGNWSASTELTVTVDTISPAAPTVSGTSPSNTPVWTWTGADAGSSYRCRLDAVTGPWTPTTATTFAPGTPLTEGAHVLYVQQADAVGNWSPTGQCTITVDYTPAAPTVPGATDIGTAAITWTWQDNATNETGFRVYAGAGAAAPGTVTFTTAAGVTARLHTGLALNTQYSFQVAATNAVRDSAKTATFSRYTLAATPVAPTVGNPTASRLDVAIAADGNPAATTYAIQLSPAVGGDSWVQAGGAVGATAAWQTAADWGTTTVTGLAGGTHYTFGVKARNGDSVETALGPTASAATLGPDINLKQGTTAIADGGSYDFGSHAASTTADIVFTVENTGNASLALTTPLTVGGTDAGQFSIQAQPASTVAASDTTTFTVRFAPTTPGAKSATVSVANNDNDENPYDLTLTGSAPAIWYVDAARPDDTGNGFTWATAKQTVQAAIDAAFAAGGGQVWVKADTYQPTVSTDRTVFLTLKSSVEVYGGFAGSETLLSQRNVAANVTILSGDIGVVGDTADNSYHVVYASGVTHARLDGFTITAGNADGSPPSSRGGGIYCIAVNSTNTIANCTINSNSATTGGGLYCDASSPVLTDCTVSGNAATTGGGLCCVSSSAPALTNCTISGNSAGTGNGGGVYCFSSSAPILTNCAIRGNLGGTGGGMYCNGSSPTLANCTISGNSVTLTGGAVTCYSASPTLINCTLDGNAAATGGGVYCTTSSLPTLKNCIFAANTQRAVHEYDAGSDPAVTNCLFYGNPDGDYYDKDTAATLTGTAAINALDGNSGNVADDPRFVNATGGDFHLRLGSAAIDRGTGGAGVPVTDLAGTPRPIDIAGQGADGTGTEFDIGAYEYTGPSTFTIAGRIALTGGSASVTSITVALSGDATQTTHPDANGDYTFSAAPLGNCTVTPTLASYVFTPLSRSYTPLDADQANQGFTGTFTDTAPVAHAGGPYTVAEGGTVGLDASGTTDAEQANTTLAYAWDFDEDGQYDDATGIAPTFSAAGRNGPVAVTVGLRVTDNGNLTSFTTATVSVTNIAPVVNAGADAAVARGLTFALPGTFTDPGADNWTATVDYGDGGGAEPLALSGKTFTLRHAYAALGTYTVTVAVTDADATGTDTLSLNVTALMTAYVDDDFGPATPGWGADHFATITAGLNAVGAGGTVHVQAGSYPLAAMLQITKACTLIGDSGASVTTITGAAGAPYVIGLEADDVTVEGFTITNPGYAGSADASGVAGHGRNLRVIGCDIHHIGDAGRTVTTDGSAGVQLWDTDGVEISGNVIHDIGPANATPALSAAGVVIRGTAARVEILANQFTGSGYGVRNGSTTLVNATRNWWGDASGPHDIKTLPGVPNYTNLAGLGTAVSASVDYYPWYTDAPMTRLMVNGVPTITTLNPASCVAGGHSFTLTINGSGFNRNYSQVCWNGAARTTTFVSATQLQAWIDMADVATAGVGQLTVVNSVPAGGTSAQADFAIMLAPSAAPSFQVTVADVAWPGLGSPVSVTLRIANVGAGDAGNVRVTGAQLSFRGTTTPLAVSYGSLGRITGTADQTFTFPYLWSGVNILQVTIAYDGGSLQRTLIVVVP